MRTARHSGNGGSYIDICFSPLRDATAREIRDCQWPDPRKIFDFSPLSAMVEKLDPRHELWYMVEMESVYDRCWALRGMEQFMMDLLTEPEIASFMLDKMAWTRCSFARCG